MLGRTISDHNKQKIPITGYFILFSNVMFSQWDVQNLIRMLITLIVITLSVTVAKSSDMWEALLLTNSFVGGYLRL